MAQVVVMPALGNTVESCLVNAWLVSVGDVVEESTPIADIETDKSTIELPAGVSGTVLALLASEGDEVPVKDPLWIVGDAGEDVSGLVVGSPASGGPAVGGGGPARGADDSVVGALTPDHALPAAAGLRAAGTPGDAGVGGYGSLGSSSRSSADTGSIEGGSLEHVSGSAAVGGLRSGVSPRARGLAAAQGVPLDAVAAGSGPHGRVIERDVRDAMATLPRGTAATKDADRAGVHGTGLGGRVTASDLANRPATQPDAARPVPLKDLVGEAEYTDTPLKGIRKLIAERMLNALATSAQLTYTATADATGMLALRKRFKGSPESLGYNGVTLGDLVCFATVQTLKRHANLNAHLLDGTLRQFRPVHLGLAVDTPRGLLVPTIFDADRLTLRQLSDTTKELAGAARSGKIDPDLLTGATFTVSNLGSFGIENFTPIINVPQTGILGVNTIAPRAYAKPDGTVGVQQRIGFSLTADHQVVDGADAGRFLADLCAAIENIDLTVMG